MTNEKIAKALGLTIGKAGNWAGTVPGRFYGKNDKVICEKIHLAAWLDSAEGQQKIRDRVRELWCGSVDTSMTTRFIKVQMGPKFTEIILLECVTTMDAVAGAFCNFPEPVVWLAALEYLTEENEK